MPVLPLAHELGKDVPVPVRVEMIGGPVATPDGNLVYTELGRDPATGMLNPQAAMVRLHLTLSSSEVEDTFETPAAEQPEDPIETELDLLEDQQQPMSSTQILADAFNETNATTMPIPEVEGGADAPHLTLTEPETRIEYEASQTIGDLVGVPRSLQAMLHNARFPPAIHADELNPLSNQKPLADGTAHGPGLDTAAALSIMPPVGNLDLSLEMEDFRQGNKVCAHPPHS